MNKIIINKFFDGLLTAYMLLVITTINLAFVGVENTSWVLIIPFILMELIIVVGFTLLGVIESKKKNYYPKE